MTTWPAKHLTSDDLDAFHSGALDSLTRKHLDDCAECRDLVVVDRKVLAMLAQVQPVGPRTGFADRVMARVAVAPPLPVPVLSYPRLTSRRIAALATLAGGMAASAVWSAANRPLLDRWLDGTAASLWAWGTAAWQAGVGTLASQPWFDTLRQLAESPGRVGLAAVALLGVYASALFALRRLVTPSTGSVSNAGA